MSTEISHKREYAQFGILRKSELELDVVNSLIDEVSDSVLTEKNLDIIKKYKPIKVTKYNAGKSSSHMARAAKIRNIINQIGTSFIKTKNK